MTRYTVIWYEQLLAHFTDAWNKSDSRTREALADVANWVDQFLALDPDKKGRPTPDQLAQVVYVPVPHARVTVTFHVLEEERQVRVLRITFVRDD